MRGATKITRCLARWGKNFIHGGFLLGRPPPRQMTLSAAEGLIDGMMRGALAEL
jgi:hypothetical protein